MISKFLHALADLFVILGHALGLFFQRLAAITDRGARKADHKRGGAR